MPVLGALLCVGRTPASAQVGNAAQKKVLVLHLMRRDEASAAANEQIYRSVLTDALTGQLDYYSESVDLARFGREDSAALRDFLKQKYKGTAFDLIIEITGARDFLRRYGAEVFPNTPSVFSMSDDWYEKSATPSNFAGIVYELDLQRVTVFTGASQAVDRSHGARARRQFGNYAGGLEFT